MSIRPPRISTACVLKLLQWPEVFLNQMHRYFVFNCQLVALESPYSQARAQLQLMFLFALLFPILQCSFACSEAVGQALAPLGRKLLFRGVPNSAPDSKLCHQSFGFSQIIKPMLLCWKLILLFS